MPAKKTKDQVLREIEERNERLPNKKIFVVEDFEYVGNHQKIRVACENGHEWNATIKFIIKDHWCPICSRKEVGKKNAKSHSDLVSKVQSRNEKHPDKKVKIKDISEYSSMNKKITWICEKGHEWKAIPKTVVNGSYCPECSRLSNIERNTNSHQDILDKLDDRNRRFPHKKVYLCEGESYTHNRDKMEFVCDDGHKWKARTNDILLKGSGCPVCAMSGFSYKAIDWLESLSRIEEIDIQHIKNSNEEFRIPGTRYKVDGYYKPTKTVYEFYGDFWHGNPNTTIPTELNSSCKTSFGDLYEKTKSRENEIKELGYNLVTMWESEWDQMTHLKYEFQYLINKKCFDGEADVVSYILGEDLPPVSLFHRESKTAINVCLFDEWVEQRIGDRYLNKKMADRARDMGIRLLIFFEDEWVDNSNLILDKISYITKRKSLPSVYARKCEVREIPSSMKSSFLKSTHIQGNDPNCLKSYGAFYDGTLVSVMTFSAPRVFMRGKQGNQDGVYELSRFASRNDMNVIGIASKLLRHFERVYNPSSIFSFADRRWSVGNLYETIGFHSERVNAPDYFYIIDGRRRHRWKYRRDAIKNTLSHFDSSLTEYQNMLNAGYDRVWGVGTLKYVK